MVIRGKAYGLPERMVVCGELARVTKFNISIYGGGFTNTRPDRFMKGDDIWIERSEQDHGEKIEKPEYVTTICLKD